MTSKQKSARERLSAVLEKLSYSRKMKMKDASAPEEQESYLLEACQVLGYADNATMEDISFDGPGLFVQHANNFPDLRGLELSLEVLGGRGSARDVLLSLSVALDGLPLPSPSSSDEDDDGTPEPESPALTYEMIAAMEPGLSTALVRVVHKAKKPEAFVISYGQALIKAFARLQHEEQVPPASIADKLMMSASLTCAFCASNVPGLENVAHSLLLVLGGFLLAPCDRGSADIIGGPAERYAVSKWPDLTKPFLREAGLGAADVLSQKPPLPDGPQAPDPPALLAKLVGAPQLMLASHPELAKFASASIGVEGLVIVAQLGGVALLAADVYATYIKAVSDGKAPTALPIRELFSLPAILTTSRLHPRCTSPSAVLFLLLYCDLPANSSIFVLTQLAQALAHLSVVASPLRRFACQKAMQRILAVCSDDDDRLTLLETLIEDGERPVRVTGLALLRPIVQDRYRNSAASVFKTHTLLESIGDYVMHKDLCLEFEDGPKDKVRLPKEEHIAASASELVEKLNFLFLLLKLDKDDLSTLRSDSRLPKFERSLRIFYPPELQQDFVVAYPKEAARLAALYCAIDRFNEARGSP